MRSKASVGVARGLCGALVLMLGLTGLAGPAFGGQSQDGSIIGQVTDESGAVLPGVTVTATGPALQVPEILSVTNEGGEYRLAPLPIGTYTVTYALVGFQTVKNENVRLTVGFVAKLDEVLKVGTLTETVTVSGTSPVVDVTSTTTSSQLTRETLELIPTGRNGLIALALQAPGVRTPSVDVGGSSLTETVSFRAYGQDLETWQTMEGVFTASPGNVGSGNYWDYASFEETRVDAIGKSAEVPQRGAQITAIVKSGGNDFHGGGFFGATNHLFQSSNLDANLAARGITGGNKLEMRRDGSGELGGRLIRDKLWFYGSARERRDNTEVPGVFQPDGSNGVYTQHQGFLTEKLSYQMSPANRIVGFYQWSAKHQIGSGLNVFIPWESRGDENLTTKVGKIEWQAVKRNLVMSLQYGRWSWRSVYIGHANGQVSTSDLVTLQTGGDSPSAGNNPGEWRHHTTGTVSWYKSNRTLGNHDLKAGFDYLNATTNRGFHTRPGADYQLVFNNGVPFQIIAYNSPTDPHTATAYLGTYVRDNWTIARRLTLSLGTRYAHDSGYVPAQCREAGTFAPAACIDRAQFKIWNSVAPRLSASYDVTGDGKTAIKGGWGRFTHLRRNDEIIGANPFVSTLTTYRWHDLNGDRLYEPGDVNLSTSGPDFISTTTREGGINTGAVPDPNEKDPTEDQFFASFERELIRNFAVRATGIYSRNFDVARRVNLLRTYDVYNIPITNPDPGPDGKVGTADDTGTFITYYDYPAAYAGSQFQANMLTNPPGQDQTFKSIEFAASKRLSSGWQLQASYSATKKHNPVPEKASFDPNTEIFAADNTWEWLSRVSGAYVFPYQVTFSANFDHRSGTAQARQVLFTGGKQIPSIALNVEPIGSIHLPNINVLDFRVEKTFTLLNRHKLTGQFNVFNSLNANTVTAQTVRAGASFLRPTAILPPRIFELSATYSF